MANVNPYSSHNNLDIIIIARTNLFNKNSSDRFLPLFLGLVVRLSCESRDSVVSLLWMEWIGWIERDFCVHNHKRVRRHWTLWRFWIRATWENRELQFTVVLRRKLIARYTMSGCCRRSESLTHTNGNCTLRRIYAKLFVVVVRRSLVLKTGGGASGPPVVHQNVCSLFIRSFHFPRDCFNCTFHKKQIVIIQRCHRRSYDLWISTSHEHAVCRLPFATHTHTHSRVQSRVIVWFSSFRYFISAFCRAPPNNREEDGQKEYKFKK